MKVFFTCSTESIDKLDKFYKAIRNEIIEFGHKITMDWIDYSINVAKRNIPDVSPSAFYKDIINAILIADVVIADATVESMSLGHQLTFALHKHKPLLIFRYKKRNEKNKELFIEGSDFKDLAVIEYENIDNITKNLRQFFKKYEKKSIRRFNLILTSTQDTYIRWVAHNFRKTKTEIIQEAIDHIAEKDAAYKKYIARQL